MRNNYGYSSRYLKMIFVIIEVFYAVPEWNMWDCSGLRRACEVQDGKHAPVALLSFRL